MDPKELQSQIHGRIIVSSDAAYPQLSGCRLETEGANLGAMMSDDAARRKVFSRARLGCRSVRGKLDLLWQESRRNQTVRIAPLSHGRWRRPRW
jgi:hypothetical protein